MAQSGLFKQSMGRWLMMLLLLMLTSVAARAAEAYACYTPSNTTLTFYYDNYRSSRTGTTYDLNTGSNDTGWDNDGTKSHVTRVVFDPSFANARPTTTHDWFYDMINLQSITGMNYLNTSEVTNMAWMFTNCKALTSLDVSHFNTSKVTSMKYMFCSCFKLAILDLSSFNTSKVTEMTWMFSNCYELTTIYAGNGWSTAATTDSNSDGMFSDCTSLVGGQGTTYNASHTNRLYAHIDGGTSNPGYFTEKSPEAYANYTPSNTTLTFYYDSQRSSRTGTTYDLNTGSNDAGWDTDGTKSSVTKVVFSPSFADARPSTTYDWFYDMQNLHTITGMEYLNTSEVTNMAYMFFYCEKLTNLDLSHFVTSKVVNMRSMFSRCYGLTSLDLGRFNTFKVTNMYNMFYDCNNLQIVYVGGGWSTAAVTNSEEMFYNCTSLVGGQGTTYNANHVDKAYAHIDGGSSNPGYFIDMGPEPYACYTPSNTTLTFYYDNLRNTRTGTTYDLNTGSNDAGWDTDGTKSHVTKVVFDPSFAGARPTTTFDWFYMMNNLESITGISYLNTSEVTNMGHMFNSCYRLTSLDLSGFNTSRVTAMNCMFYGCSNLRTIYVGNGWSTAAVTNSDNMFKYCSCLVGGQGTTYSPSHVDAAYAHIDGGTSNPGYLTAKTEAYACYTPSNTTLTFYYDNLRNTRTGTTYDLNTGVNDTGWKTDDVVDYVTQVVFDPSFANARPTTNYEWFFGMQNLQAIEGIEYLNTSEVTNMDRMFGWCSELTSLDLSHFNTSMVTSMAYMFYRCSGLTCLDLSSFNTSNVTDMRIMFYDCSNLTTIYAGEGWSTEAVTNSSQMFNYSTRLVGGQGTTYDANHVDAAYAHIDGGPSNPGYFTDKNASLRGDVDGDNDVTIADVSALIDYLLTGDPTGINLAAANCDGDSEVSIADVSALIDYLLTGSW